MKQSPFPEPAGFVFDTGENGAFKCYYAPNRHRGEKGIYIKSVSPTLAAEWRKIRNKAAQRKTIYEWIAKHAPAKGIEFKSNQ